MSDFLTPSNLKALNLGQPPYYLLKYCIESYKMYWEVIRNHMWRV